MLDSLPVNKADLQEIAETSVKCLGCLGDLPCLYEVCGLGS